MSIPLEITNVQLLGIRSKIERIEDDDGGLYYINVYFDFDKELSTKLEEFLFDHTNLKQLLIDELLSEKFSEYIASFPTPKKKKENYFFNSMVVGTDDEGYGFEITFNENNMDINDVVKKIKKLKGKSLKAVVSF